jgi:hypothetical protein
VFREGIKKGKYKFFKENSDQTNAALYAAGDSDPSVYVVVAGRVELSTEARFIPGYATSQLTSTNLHSLSAPDIHSPNLTSTTTAKQHLLPSSFSVPAPPTALCTVARGGCVSSWLSALSNQV